MWPKNRGDLIENWEDKGARNHIEVWALFNTFMLKRREVEELNGVKDAHVKEALIIINETGISFKWEGRNISVVGVIISQFKTLPIVIAASLKKVVGAEQNLSVSLIRFIGKQLLGAHTVTKRNRIVYAVVNPVAKRKRVINAEFIE